MNFLDIILIFLEVIATVVWIILEVIAFREDETGFIFGLFLAWLVTISALALPWITVDKKSGMTVGYITSVDKNFFRNDWFIFKNYGKFRRRILYRR